MSGEQAPTGSARQPAGQVWVLAGASGAVGAIDRFFQALSSEHALAFVVALDTSPKGAALAARLLAKTTPYAVHASGLERTLYPRDVLVVALDGPMDSSGESGEAREPQESSRLRTTTKTCMPSLDQVLLTVAGRYRDQAGVIMLSGIARQGADGCRAISRLGGKVWTQDNESAQFSALPRFIRDICDVGLSAPPEALAARVIGGPSQPRPRPPTPIPLRAPARP
jgi:chemotaxis response regulator CheB